MSRTGTERDPRHPCRAKSPGRTHAIFDRRTRRVLGAVIAGSDDDRLVGSRRTGAGAGSPRAPLATRRSPCRSMTARPAARTTRTSPWCTRTPRRTVRRCTSTFPRARRSTELRPLEWPASIPRSIPLGTTTSCRAGTGRQRSSRSPRTPSTISVTRWPTRSWPSTRSTSARWAPPIPPNRHPTRWSCWSTTCRTRTTTTAPRRRTRLGTSHRTTPTRSV